MAVAYISDADKTPATSSSIVWTSYAVSGTNPVILVLIALDHATATVSSVAVSAGLSAGTPVEVTTFRSTSVYLSLWAIPAPTGTGTITATLSASVPWQSTAMLMQGAHQTTPCAGADAVSTGSESAGVSTVTVSNFVAGDAAVGIGAVVGGDDPIFTQNQIFYDNSTSINASAGYNLAAATLSVTWGSTGSARGLAGVRVAQASAGNSSSVSPSVSASVSPTPSPSSSVSPSPSPSTAALTIVGRSVLDYDI